MFHGRKLKHKTNKIHERALRVVYNDNQWIAFSQYTKKTLQKLAIEMFKVNNGLSVQLVSENFHFAENHYNFRHQPGAKFKVDHVNTETYGKQSVSYFGPKIWNSIP